MVVYSTTWTRMVVCVVPVTRIHLTLVAFDDAMDAMDATVWV